MKKVLVFFIVGVVIFGACSAQNADKQIARRIIGTWVDHEGSSWVFNADGNLTISGGPRAAERECKFGIIDTQLIYSYRQTDRSYGSGPLRGQTPIDVVVFNVSISSDSRMIILTSVGDDYNYWLTKE